MGVVEHNARVLMYCYASTVARLTLTIGGPLRDTIY